jgi:tetratricopeptide (TPR) repeat protein
LQLRTLFAQAELYESQGAAKQNATSMQMSYELASAVKARYPGTWRARMVQANVLYRAGRLAEAAEGFRAVLDLEPRSHAALNNLGAILQQSDPPRLQEALVVYAAALALPNSVRTHARNPPRSCAWRSIRSNRIRFCLGTPRTKTANSRRKEAPES